MTRYTLAIPEAKIDEANTAMVAFTGNQADSQTFGAASLQDIHGNRYAVCSGIFASQPIDIEGMLISTLDNGREAIAALGLQPVGEGA